MKLFTKDIDKKLFDQYQKGSSLDTQKVVAKIFNPYGQGRWYLMNSDPTDPDYIWGIVQMGDVVEIGSISRKMLENIRVSPFRFPLERDLGFVPRMASEVFEGLQKGNFFKHGGLAELGAEAHNDEIDDFDLGGETHKGYKLNYYESVTTRGGEKMDRLADHESTGGDYDTVLEKAKEKMASGRYSHIDIYDLSKQGIAAKLKKDGEVVKYEKGGEAKYSNKAMLENIAETMEHHIEEFEEALKKSDDNVMPWVLTKAQRAVTDLQDITHYLDSQNEINREKVEGEENYAMGGDLSWTKAEIGDSALVVSENKMGVIIKPYGRKFHLKFVDGSEKTYDASELKFMSNEEYGNGGSVKGKYVVKFGFVSDDGEYEVGKSKPIYADNEEDAAQKLQDQFESYEGTSCDVISVEKVMEGGGWIDEVNMKMNELKKKYPKAKVSYYFAKNPNGKNYVVEVKEEGKLIYSTYNDNQKMEGGGEVDYDELKQVFLHLKSKLNPDSHQEKLRDDTTEQEKKEGILAAMIRHWGNWEDDYLDSESEEKLEKIISETKSKYPDVEIEWSNSEKKILSFEMSNKKMEGGGSISSPNIKFMKWFVDWLKSVNKYVHVSISIPNEFSSPIKDNNGKIVMLDVIEKKGDADAKKYMNEILKKADEFGVSIYLEPIPRTHNLKNQQHKNKITKDYLIKYYEKFGFEKTKGGFMVREPKMAEGGEVKFKDKVASIKKSLLERKKVPKAVQKDYGKTFSPKEAEDSAKRIVGAMTAKERLMKKIKPKKSK